MAAAPIEKYDAVVIGAGFYGCNIALWLSKRFDRVLLVESSSELMGRASFVNQARVHGGYHYPKSMTTGLRCQANYLQFLSDYGDCLHRSHTALYAVAGRSEVSSEQFWGFCQRIKAPIQAAPKDLKKLFEPSLIDDVFVVEECAFDAKKIRDKIATQIRDSKIELRLGTEVEKVQSSSGVGGAVLHWKNGGQVVEAKNVFVCVYSQLNRLLGRSGLDGVPLKLELAEVALVRPPAELHQLGITIVCGAYFSLMPFPALNAHSFTHVRFTPHLAWNEPGQSSAAPDASLPAKQFVQRSQYIDAMTDAKRYVKSIDRSEYVESLFEFKAILPRNEADDGRPILFSRHSSLRSLVYILGGKIDNIYDVYDALDLQLSKNL